MNSPRRAATVTLLFALFVFLCASVAYVAPSLPRAQSSDPIAPSASLARPQANSSATSTAAILRPAAATDVPARPQTNSATASVAPTLRPPPATAGPGQPAATASAMAVSEQQQILLQLINSDRAKNGLKPVLLDLPLSAVAERHAREMAENGYLSHWNMAGVGPDVRAGQAGLTDVALENAYALSGNIGPSLTRVQLADAQESWMNSPGHRTNILDPLHTHVGVGVWFDARAGQMRAVQLFANHYVTIEGCPIQTVPGSKIVLSGRQLPGVKGVFTDLAYQPAPRPLSVTEIVQKPRVYASEAQSVARFATPAVMSGDAFRAEITIPREAGIYHVRFFGDLASNGQLDQIGNCVISVP